MTTQTSTAFVPDLEYPDSDGQPMSDNTLQFQWIVTLQGNLDALFLPQADVFVAGDLLWYPVEGHPEIRTAPDTMVVFGRRKGYRGSYQQWREGGIAPQVAFEVLSPGNRPGEMEGKFAFYDQYEVEEYYVYDPERVHLSGWIREHGRLRPILELHGWVSPRLGIRFDLSGEELVIYGPDGERFLTFVELKQ
jgi:Uma2 family endonuclease